MSFRPDIRNGFFDVIPMDWMTPEEVGQLGYDLHAMVGDDEATRAMLEERHLDGVIVRHAELDSSVATVTRARALTIDTSDTHFGVLKDGSEWIGMGSIMPGLPLRRPQAASGMLPAGLTRCSRYLSSPVATNGPNITAWVGHEHAADRLADVYGVLGEIAGNGAWTIEPVRSTLASRSIRAAGFSAVYSAVRYDDMESATIPPLAQYFERRI